MKKYIAPEVDVIEIMVEFGFVLSEPVNVPPYTSEEW